MCSNLIKLNQDKTELMSFAPKHRANELTDFSISFGGNIIHDTPYVNDIGAYFDRTLSMEKQCNAIARSTFGTFDAFVLSFLKMHAQCL
jgi:hypothetical protein